MLASVDHSGPQNRDASGVEILHKFPYTLGLGMGFYCARRRQWRSIRFRTVLGDTIPISNKYMYVACRKKTPLNSCKPYYTRVKRSQSCDSSFGRFMFGRMQKHIPWDRRLWHNQKLSVNCRWLINPPRLSCGTDRAEKHTKNAFF